MRKDVNILIVLSRERKTDVRHDNRLQIFAKAAAGWKEIHQ